VVVHKHIPSDRKIILAGDIGKVFSDAGVALELHYEVCEQLLDAVAASMTKNFEAIATVISDAPVKLSSSLKMLRDHSSAKIFLLAQMHEEPLAIRLTESYYNGVPLADDYMICPVQADKFYEFLTCREPAPFMAGPLGIDSSLRQQLPALTQVESAIDAETKRKSSTLRNLQPRMI